MNEPTIKLNGKSWKPIFASRDDMAVRDAQRDGHVCVLQDSVVHRLVECDAVRVFCADDNMKCMFDIVAYNDECCLLVPMTPHVASTIKPECRTEEVTSSPRPHAEEVIFSMQGKAQETDSSSYDLLELNLRKLPPVTDEGPVVYPNSSCRLQAEKYGMDKKVLYVVSNPDAERITNMLQTTGACAVTVDGKVHVLTKDKSYCCVREMLPSPTCPVFEDIFLRVVVASDDDIVLMS